MERGLRERVRWGNVAAALGLVAVLGVVVAWPLLAPDAPVVPGREVPVATRSPSPPASPAPRRSRPPRASPAHRGDRPVRRPRPRRRHRSVRRPARDVRPRVGAVVRGERRAGEGGGGAVPVRRAPAVRAAPLVSEKPPPPAVPPAPAVQGAPAPADPDPVVREFSFEVG